MRRALMANRHVLVIGPAALSAKQLLSLEDLARRRSRVAFIDTGYACDERVAFIGKMTAPSAALWRPRYVRAVRSGSEGYSLDELVIAEIACVLSIMGGAPSHVSAVAPRIDDETGHADAAMLTMTFDGGPVATVDVSLVEPMPRRETVIACDGRTIIMDAFDVRAPLQIQAAGRHRGPQAGRSWSETVSEYPASSHFDREAAVASTFVAAVRARDVATSNLRDLAAAAATWECARASMARGGELERLSSDASNRPELQVIVGGGNASEERETPALTVIHSAS
jgi:predicted dehydrogenase